MVDTNRLQQLEEREQLKELRAKYCYYVDEQNWEPFFELFAPDPILDFGGMGIYHGRDGLERFAAEFVEAQLESSAHMLSNPILELDGDEATGRWYVESPLTFADGSGAWRQGWYRDEYRRLDGEWRIDTMKMRFAYMADYDDENGWSDLRVI